MGTGGQVRFGVLGGLGLTVDGAPVQLGGRQQQVVLAVLLLHANRWVSVDQLARYLWGEEIPSSAMPALRNHIAGVRRTLRAAGLGDRVRTGPQAYSLTVEAGELDLDRFETAVAEAQQATEVGQPLRAHQALVDALALWRGPALDGVHAPMLARDVVPRLEERRLLVVERRLDADLALGRHAEVVGELRVLTETHPLRERPYAQLMTALYRSGRQAEALEVYQALRSQFVAELGIEPGAEVRGLQQSILVADPALDLAPPASGAAGTAPPTGSATAETVVTLTPGEVPADTPTFTGRAAELAVLDRWLEGAATAVTVVSGTAGVGKTALAVRWAHRVADRFPDGQLYLNLRGHGGGAPMTAAEALGRLLRSLGIPPDSIPAEEDEQAARFRSLLARRRMLIVLDDARSAEQVRPLLPGHAGCLTLVTSRQVLGGLAVLNDAQLVSLDLLETGEAVDLLRRVLGDSRVDAEPAAAVALARACAQLPLALRIAAAHLLIHRHSTVAGLVAQLNDGPRLDTLQVPGDPATSVLAAFELSCRALDPRARLLFRRLGLMAGPDFTVAEGAVLVDCARSRAETLFTQLASAHLVDGYLPGRFRLHDLLREYAAELCRAEESEPEQAAATDRLFGWYLRRTDAAARVISPYQRRPPIAPETEPPFADRAAALAWLENERANLVVMARRCVEVERHDVAIQLPGALWGFFELGGHCADWVGTFTIGLASAQTLGNRNSEAWLATGLGLALGTAHRFAEAIDHCEHALTIRRELDDPFGENVTLGTLGGLYSQVGKFDRAVACFQRGLDICERISHPIGACRHLTGLGDAYRQMGQLAAGLDSLRRAMRTRHNTNHPLADANTLTCLGDLHRDAGRLDEAIVNYRGALAIHRASSHRWQQGVMLEALGHALHDNGERAEAHRCWREAAAVFDGLGDPRGVELEALLADADR